MNRKELKIKKILVGICGIGNGTNLEKLILTKQQLKEFFKYLKIVKIMVF